MEQIKNKKGFICDMDGVIYHGSRLLQGSKEFVDWLYREKKKFLFLTNSPAHTPRELSEKLGKMGIDVNESHFYTSAIAAASFIQSQKPGSSAYVIGGSGLVTALYDAGIKVTDVNPDYVVSGEGGANSYENIVKAVELVNKGAKLIGTNCDLSFPIEKGLSPGCRAMLTPIEKATGVKAYYIGKPNPLMMQKSLEIMDLNSEDAAMIGDRMDTDVLAGIESDVDTILVLSGVTDRVEMNTYSFLPKYVFDGIGDIL